MTLMDLLNATATINYNGTGSTTGPENGKVILPLIVYEIFDLGYDEIYLA